MKYTRITPLALIFLTAGATVLSAQVRDTIKDQSIHTVTVQADRIINGVGHLSEEKDGVIYACKKTEVIIADSIDANKAIDNTRQILGRIPGLNIVETESSGFTANGIATRGLNPSQSIEMNTRQNGYNISADVFGYNEAYYLPPMEAVDRIEFVRGAAALQFGAQFGGLVNYVLKEYDKRKLFSLTTSQTIGSYGMYNSFTGFGGGYKKISYSGFIQYRNTDGYRPNSQQWQLSGFGKVAYTPNDKMQIGVEYTLLRNQIKMPGGLSDSLFYANPRTSTRARNWLRTPWNIINAYWNYNLSDHTSLYVKANYMFSERSLVWRNEDGGPSAPDNIDSTTLQYSPREVEKEIMHNTTAEIRLSHHYTIANQQAVLSAGLRFSYGWFKRLGGGEGTTGSDFDLSIHGDWEYNLDFTTLNVSPFIENIFHIGERLSIAPGFRFEYLRNTVSGYKGLGAEQQDASGTRNRAIPLAGLGIAFRPTYNTTAYANISQAYRPIDYSQLEPFGAETRIDPNLKDAYGYSADLGYRGTIRNYLNFDISGFYLAYNNRIGITLRYDETTQQSYLLRTNIANSVHQGVESYIEFNLLKCLDQGSKYGLSVFNSFAYIDAHYTTGIYTGKRVETAANIINRTGLIFSNRALSVTFQCHYVGDAYGDASNARYSEDPSAGYIPSYTLLDVNASYKIKNYTLKAGVNNITDQSYFTRRTDEYPGPGIIPASGRSIYFGFSASF